MSYLSGALSDILRELHWKQSDLAAKSGILAPQVNRYVRGVNVIPPESVGKLLAALPDDTHPRLLVAYLRDCLPDGTADRVRIEPINNRVQNDPAHKPIIEGVDRELDKMLRVYADLAMRHHEVRDMLRSFLDAIGALRQADGQ